MRVLLAMLFFMLGLADSAAAQPGERETSTISITPAASVEPQPVVQVETSVLPDVGPDRMLERYLDGVFEGQIAAARIPGAAVVVIRNGEIVLKKGYGFANLDHKTPIDPDSTLFRVASISKLFTALAAMQEVDAGRLSLNTDVNGFLKSFKLTPVGSDPVTLGSLLDHTSGFDDKFLGIATPMGAPREDLGVHLAANMPRLVLPTGKVFNYSNYGYALAGHLTEQAASTGFRTLISERIFSPLGMANSSFGIPDPVPAGMATPYKRLPDGLAPARLDQLTIYPAGDLVTTAGDLSRFMLALLKDGGGLVTPETFKSMLAPRIVPGETGDAWGLGFALGESNGVKWFGHGGAWPGFAAEMRLNAETRSGFLILVNTDNTPDIVQPLVNALTDGIWPSDLPKPSFDAKRLKANAEALEGTFIPVRRSRHDSLKLGMSFSTVRLSADNLGRLAGTFGGMQQKLVFEPLRDGVWRERVYRWQLSAYPGTDGVRDGLLLGPFAFERPRFSDDFRRQIPLLAVSGGVFALILVTWAAGAFGRRMFGEPMTFVSSGARLSGSLAALFGLIFIAGFAGTMTALTDQDVLEGQLGPMPYLLTLPIVIAPLTLAVAFFAGRGFGPGLRARMAQGGFVLLTLSLIILLWFAWTWNLHIFAR